MTNENRDRIIKYIEKQQFLNLVGFQIDVVEEGLVEGRMKLEGRHTQQKGLLHGGVTATVADVVSGFAAYTLVKDSQHVVTAELKISYLNPGIGEEIYAKGWVLKTGRRMNFCEAEVYVVSGKERVMVAKATSTMVTIEEGDLKR